MVKIAQPQVCIARMHNSLAMIVLQIRLSILMTVAIKTWWTPLGSLSCAV